MTKSEKLREYARIIVKMGVNVTSDRYVVVRCPIDAAELGRLVEREAFAAGAKDVVILWTDPKSSRIRYEMAAEEVFENIPDWQAESRNYYAREGCCSISIVGEDPEAFAGVPSGKLLAQNRAADRAYKEFYKILDQGGVRWTVVAYPSTEWAAKVFPDDAPDVAVEKLWDAIFATVRVSETAVADWQAHDSMLKSRAKALNDAKFVKLNFKNSLGTDFTVGLADGHIWKGGSETDRDGVDYFPNLPTEEIFTMPDRRIAEGTVYSSMPLSYQGELIDKFWLTFTDGAVTDFGAEKGEHALKRLLDTDDGSKRLGEVALVPYDSPIRASGVLFYETLFDENASCHLALGECYPDTMAGGETLSEEELLEKGGNSSANHVDFMIGTADLAITGIDADGNKTAVFENGNFVI